MYHGNNTIQRVFDKAPLVRMNDAAIASGLAFLNGELEKRDPKLYEPLTSVTWQRDIVAEVGSGWGEYTSNYFVDYATTGSQTSGIIGSDTNNIPMMQANISKDNFKVFSWANILRVPFVGQELLKQVGRSLDDILDKGIKLGWNKDLDTMTYEGFDDLGVYGLVNNPDITTSTAAAVGTGSTTTWSTKTPDQILDDINTVLNNTWAASEYDLSGMANHVLVAPSNFMYLQRKVSEAGNVSIFQYIMENNVATAQGREIVIVPCRWCEGAGANSTNRMVAYVNDKDRVRIDIPVMLNRIMTQPDVQNMAYLTAYAGQIGQVKFLYPQCAAYVDGI